MAYTDKELIRASQVAYLTINEEVITQVYRTLDEESKNSNNQTLTINYSLSELIKYSKTFKNSAYKDVANYAGLEIDAAITGDRDWVLGLIDDPVKKQMAKEKYSVIDDITSGEIGSWKVVSYVDNNTIGTPGMAGQLVNGSWVHHNFSNSGDGLAAMVFETGAGRAITAFRGSEEKPKKPFCSPKKAFCPKSVDFYGNSQYNSGIILLKAA